MAKRRNRRASPKKVKSRRQAEPARRARARTTRRRIAPEDRKAHNRSLVFFVLLALVNLYVFVIRDSGIEVTDRPMTASLHRGGILPPLADAPEHGCGGDPVRIFEGRESLIQGVARLHNGDTLRLGLLRLGVLGPDVDLFESAVASKFDPTLVAAGARLHVAADRSGALHALEIELGDGHVVQACRESGTVSVEHLRQSFRSEPVVVSLTFGKDASLAKAVAASGERPDLERLIATRLAGELDARVDPRPGDTIQAIVEKRWLGEHFHRYGRLLAIRYAGHMGRFAFYLDTRAGGGGAYYDRRGQAQRRSLLRSAVGYHEVRPGARALLEPVVEGLEGRPGLSYRAPLGAPVLALGDAKVEASGVDPRDGTWLRLRMSDGTSVMYAHLHRIRAGLEAGSRVRQGELVAVVGRSGEVPTPRLRLELATADETLDPLILTSRRRARVDAEEVEAAYLAEYKKRIEPWRRTLLAAARR